MNFILEVENEAINLLDLVLLTENAIDYACALFALIKIMNGGDNRAIFLKGKKMSG